MDKNEQRILVAPTEKVLGSDYFEGFRPADGVDYESRILGNALIMRRGDAEEDPSHKQPIGYAVIVNPATKQVFAYQRAGDGNYDENRLSGKWSWGVGGHIETEDTEGNPITNSLLRELEEEVTIEGSTKAHVLGYINDDSNDVGKVHFGILYYVETDATKVSPADGESQHGEMMDIAKLDELAKHPGVDVENWSKIALEPLKALLV